jgi:hypothetical protein
VVSLYKVRAPMAPLGQRLFALLDLKDDGDQEWSPAHFLKRDHDGRCPESDGRGCDSLLPAITTAATSAASAAVSAIAAATTATAEASTSATAFGLGPGFIDVDGPPADLRSV